MLVKYGRPTIFIAHRGSRLINSRFTGILEAAGMRGSLDRRDYLMENRFINQLASYLRYGCAQPYAFEI
jgi:hypothetical protein